jgi:predicted TIM-barrel fold metal-dependent hydrolase
MRLPFTVYSSDCHIIEPADLWTARMDDKWRHLAPRIEHLDDTDIWVVDKDTRLAVVGIQDQAGFRFDDPNLITKKSRMEDLPRGEAGWTPALYLKGLETDGVSGGVLYPSTAVQAYRSIEGPLLAAVAATYNDWLKDFCSEDPNRLKMVAMIAVDDVEEGVREMQRSAKMGAAALLLPIFPAHPKSWDMPEFAPIWACAADLNLPVVFHLGTNQKAKFQEPPLDLIVHATKDVHVQRSIAILCLSGIFGKHPNLRVGAIEFGASWAGPMLARLDAMAERHREALPWRFPDGEKPSDHFRRNVFLSFQDDIACIAMRKHLGVQNLQWGNDYPHAESTFPRSQEFLAEHFASIPAEEAAAIAGLNTAKMYGFPLPQA